VTSGKLDLLYLCDNELLLIELKVEDFYGDIIRQISGYYDDLKGLQKQNKLINAEIRKIILVTGYKQDDPKKCQESNISLVAYNPQVVLTKYYENFREMSYFLKIQSGQQGIVRLGLLKETLKILAAGKNAKQIAEAEHRSVKTIGNRLLVALQMGLVVKYQNKYFLTDMGNEFVEVQDSTVDDRLSEKQIELLSEFIKQNPFRSATTYTIFAVLETVFVLAKNTYPVPKDAVKDYFIKSVGKTATWRTDKARETATYIFSNYACELELLAKIDNRFFITPKGIQAILLLQLNRSIKLIESQK
jgi:hypothetical protein